MRVRVCANSERQKFSSSCTTFFLGSGDLNNGFWREPRRQGRTSLRVRELVEGTVGY